MGGCEKDGEERIERDRERDRQGETERDRKGGIEIEIEIIDEERTQIYEKVRM